MAHLSIGIRNIYRILCFVSWCFARMIVKETVKKIFPSKDETWAVFEKGYMNWKSNASIQSGYFEYEFDKILLEYREGVGAFVAIFE